MFVDFVNFPRTGDKYIFVDREREKKQLEINFKFFLDIIFLCVNIKWTTLFQFCVVVE